MEQSREDQIEHSLMLKSREVNELINFLQPFPRGYVMTNIVRKLNALQIQIAESNHG